MPFLTRALCTTLIVSVSERKAVIWEPVKSREGNRGEQKRERKGGKGEKTEGVAGTVSGLHLQCWSCPQEVLAFPGFLGARSGWAGSLKGLPFSSAPLLFFATEIKDLSSCPGLTQGFTLQSSASLLWLSPARALGGD